MTLLATGARPAELIPSARSTHTPLLKREVNFTDATIVIRPLKRQRGQKKKARTVELPAHLILFPLLRGQMDRTPGDFVFPPQPNHHRDFDNMLKRAGILKYNELDEVLRVHSFRHSHATLMHDAGADQFVLKAALGHRQLSTTARYVHPRTPVVPFNLDKLATYAGWQPGVASAERVKGIRPVTPYMIKIGA